MQAHACTHARAHTHTHTHLQVETVSKGAFNKVISFIFKPLKTKHRQQTVCIN